MNNKAFLLFLGLIKKSGNLIEGYNMCEEALSRRKIHLIVLSKDVSENTRKKFIKYTDAQNIPVITACDKEELGKALGRKEIHVLGVTDSKMGKKLSELWCESN